MTASRSRFRAPTLLVLVIALAGGCSSSHPTIDATAAQKQAALELARIMLDNAVLPRGANPITPAREGANIGFDTPGIGNVVNVDREWTTTESPRSVYAWLQTHRSSLFRAGGGMTGTDQGVPKLGVSDVLAQLPENVSYAEVQFTIATASGGARIGVDASVGWTSPRPADEFVPASDKTVTISVVHADNSAGIRVATSDATVVKGIVAAFNALRVAPPQAVYHCPPGGKNLYRVAFSESESSPPSIVATVSNCGPFRVSVNGLTAPSLIADGDVFVNDVARVLGFSELHFG